MSSERWAIYIDIEGFRALWEHEDQVLRSLADLMGGIFRVARECYPSEPDRLFAHQFGDGFLIASDHHEASLDRCATIAVALMRQVASGGRFARATIAEGELSDIQGCYPKEVLQAIEGEHTVSLGMGLMTLTPVMGTALIRAVGADKSAPRGPLLLIPRDKSSRLGPGMPLTSVPGTTLMSIDWVHAESPHLDEIQDEASLTSPSPAELEAILREYCRTQSVPDEWRESVVSLLGVACRGDLPG